MDGQRRDILRALTEAEVWAQPLQPHRTALMLRLPASLFCCRSGATPHTFMPQFRCSSTLDFLHVIDACFLPNSKEGNEGKYASEWHLCMEVAKMCMQWANALIEENRMTGGRFSRRSLSHDSRLDMLFYKKRGGNLARVTLPCCCFWRSHGVGADFSFPKGHGERLRAAFDLQVGRLSGPHTPHGFTCSTVCLPASLMIVFCWLKSSSACEWWFSGWSPSTFRWQCVVFNLKPTDQLSLAQALCKSFPPHCWKVRG